MTLTPPSNVEAHDQMTYEASGQLLTPTELTERLGFEAGRAPVVTAALDLGLDPLPRYLLGNRKTVYGSREVEQWLSDHDPRAELRYLAEQVMMLADFEPRRRRLDTPRPRPIGEDDTEAEADGPVECEPWCSYGDSHRNVRFRVDQRCWCEELRVELSLHPELPNTVHEDGAWQSAPDWVAVYPVRVPEQPVEVWIVRGEGPEVRYTPSEAKQLHDALGAVLDQIDAAEASK